MSRDNDYFAQTPAMEKPVVIRADNEREARAKLRAMLGLKRLPLGTEIY
jgi:hypothetical protein